MDTNGRRGYSWIPSIYAWFQRPPPDCTDSEVKSLHSRAKVLAEMFIQGDGHDYIDEAITLDREALELCPPGDRMRFECLTWLAYHLWHRYNQLGSMTVLTEATMLAREAFDSCPSGHPTLSMSSHTLAACLFSRYNRLGTTGDLDEAIALNRKALELRPPGHPERWKSLNSLANNFSSRYRQVGAVEHLDEAIVLDQEALSLFPQGHPDRLMSLNNLGVHLSTRYDHLRAIQDLEKAIELGREALTVCPLKHTLRSTSLSRLALFLFNRYYRFKEMKDLDEAIVLDRDALKLFPQGHPARSVSLNNLAIRLSTRYKQLEAVKDLNEAIALDLEALELRPPGHPLRSSSLNNLGHRLFTRYERSRVASDLDRAIDLGREALSLCSPGHPSRSQALENLARYLRSRFVQSSQEEDKRELFALYTRLEGVHQMVSFTDLCATRAWTHVAEDFEHPTTLQAYEAAFRSLVHYLATLPSLTQHLVILKSLTSSLAVDACSACLRNNAPARAVELLEQGRGVFWSQLTRLHSPLDDVIASGSAGKMLAREFTQLASDIQNVLNSPGAGQHDRLCHLSVELDKVVTQIRELPGFARFLLPSLFSDLRLAASGGPVVIVNASKYSCDALVVLMDRDPVHIPLKISREYVQLLSSEFHTLTNRATKADVESITKGFGNFLRKLWNNVVEPVVDRLQTIAYPRGSRIWWCPTAEFCLLPLHAAGPYRKGQLNLADIYISSYTPTLAALIRARRPGSLNSVNNEKGFVAIGQANPIGEHGLQSVGRELTNISQLVEHLATFTRIEGPESSITRVTEELSRNEWVHFACHGLPNRRKPFESAFALYDGPFTIERLIRCELENPEFAYLSACHTTVGDERSPDEVIHLASAMQFAGFRSVVGTMWAVDDSKTIEVTSTFYRHVVDESGRLDHTRAALALNKVTRFNLANVPFDQRVLYVHFGI